MRNQRSGAAALVLPLLFVLCSSWLNAQDRHWEILTLLQRDNTIIIQELRQFLGVI